MLLSREFYDPGLVFLAVMAVIAAVLAIQTVRRGFDRQAGALGEAGQLIGTVGVGGLSAWIGTGHAAGSWVAALLALALILGLLAWLPRLTMAGAVEMAVPPFALAVMTPWSYLLLRDLGFPDWALTLSLAGSAGAALAFGFVFASKLAHHALLTHGDWTRPNAPLPPHAGTGRPKVSIHLPCYSEPPEVVIATIDHVARLDYADFEVLVCDNNTEDEALWRPLEAHCARLNRRLGFERFRFFHVAPLAGAKAGALNYLLDRMAPDAELVAVIDADYLAEPDFLSRLVGYFDDPRIGYIQTPHDYRAYEGAPYLGMCYWEYMPNNKVELPGINEYGAAYTIGTMCILRTEALNAAGRWAEWCLTEDSEVSVRLRALGYDGIYLRETFGRGLIPETFADYKKQRFRWMAGPVQQLRRYWRLYLPQPFGEASGIGGWSKLLEPQRGLYPLLSAVGTAAGLFGGLAAAVMTAKGSLPQVVLPDVAWVAMILFTVAGLLKTWLRYRLAGCTRIVDMAGGEVARLSLTWVTMVAGLAGFSGRPLAWRRTPKFQACSSGALALQAALPETVIGLAHLALLAIPLGLADSLGAHFTLLAVVATLLSAFRFLSAPLMAYLSERRLAPEVERDYLPAAAPEAVGAKI